MRWFSPAVLSQAALRVLIVSAFGTFLDKRELQEAIDPERHDVSGAEELWFDYVADTGDGFDATYTMASLLARPALDVGLERALPRGSLLICGGDQVYPVAGATAYEERFVGPFRAALPGSDEPAPSLFAIPGNHDWYDGLTSFMRVYCQDGGVGGWRTRQRRSYFGIRLPGRWWLWGIDTQLDAYLDKPQLDYFRSLPVEPHDRIIVCTAEPKWVDAGHDPNAFRNLAYLERTVIVDGFGAELALTLSGDSHHYARYAAADGSQKVTAGGGGAFLHPTHNLPERLDITIDPGVLDKAGTPRTEEYRLEHRYPAPGTSRRLLWRTLLLPWWNPSFIPVPGLLALFAVWASPPLLRPSDDVATWGDVAQTMATSPVVVLVVVFVTAALIGMAKPPDALPPGDQERLTVKTGMGIVHAAGQIAAIVTVVWAARALAAALADGPLFGAVVAALVLVAGGVVAGVVLGVYLIVANLALKTHDNEAFSAHRHTGSKNFLRLHIDRDGGLTIYPIGVDRVTTGWRFEPGGGEDDHTTPWYVAAGPAAEPRLIEEPITVTPGRPR